VKQRFYLIPRQRTKLKRTYDELSTAENRPPKFHLSAFAIIISTFTWFSLISVVFTDTINGLGLPPFETFTILSLYYIGTIASAFLGATAKSSRGALLKFWMLLGTVSSLLLLFIDVAMPLSAFLVAVSLGFSIGLGLPSSLAYFTDSIRVENRGLLGGVAYGLVSAAVVTLALLIGVVDFATVVFLLALVRGLGLVLFLLFEKKTEEAAEVLKAPSYTSILGGKTLALYFVPWLMFCLINWMEMPVVEGQFPYELLVLSGVVEVAIAGVSAPISGYFSDKIGRKRVIVTGFVVLGVGYAALGLFPQGIIAQYSYIVLDGVAWGIFASVFFMILWGDVAEDAQKERFYFVGGFPYLLAQFLAMLSQPYFRFIQPNAAFSLASFFLFFAVLPLLYAPEPLPERRLKEREMKEYIERAKKAKEKYT